MEKRYFVYMHTNKLNQKRYIGMSGSTPDIRWQGGNGYRTNKEFYADILAQGWSGFKHEILYQNLTKEEAQKKEVELIKMYKTQDSEFGYNKNGYHCNTWSNYVPKVKEHLIHCVELNLTFKTALAAREATGVDNSSILKACRGERKTAGKHPETGESLHWKFIDVNQEEQ